MNRKTKIVATIGPSCQDELTIRQLVLAGMDVARLNFSHGTYTDHTRTVTTLREVSEELGQALTILQDLPGPKIRTGQLENHAVEISAGDPLILTSDSIVGSRERVGVSFPGLAQTVQIGGRILLDDGRLELEVTGIQEQEVHTQVILGGTLKENKGVNLPGADLSISGFTEEDEKDLAYGLKLGVDVIALSFICCADDIIRARQSISQIAPEHCGLPLIAKLERPQAIENLEEIIQAADGVMVARGDLGVEMSPQMVPTAQKEIIACANYHGKLVITATQMLDSMVHNRRPTRAEASDVANAIYDGSDAVMLSGETAIGDYPVETVQMMDAIICEAEGNLSRWGHWDGDTQSLPEDDDAVSMARAARELAHDRNVDAIAVFTQSGRTAQLMSKTRPRVIILAFTPDKTTYHRLGILWGVVPHLIPMANTVEEMLSLVEKAMLTATPIHPGQQVVLVAGFPVGAMRLPNFALLHTVGVIGG